ncbi:MAG: acetolactate synthase small subunit [Eubacteriales bacterium]|jgi:acetolactate synthase-1/3 small subunit
MTSVDMEPKRQFVLSLLVSNHFGVLTRISGLFARRGFNIDSLTVGVTENPEYSRMTIVSQGDEYIREQMVRQLRKLEDVKVVRLMPEDNTVMRELLLVKVKLEPGKLSEIVEAANTFRANVVDLSPDSVLIEITGDKSKLDAFIEYYKPYGIIEISRTGITAVGRSTNTLFREDENGYEFNSGKAQT